MKCAKVNSKFFKIFKNRTYLRDITETLKLYKSAVLKCAKVKLYGSLLNDFAFVPWELLFYTLEPFSWELIFRPRCRYFTINTIFIKETKCQHNNFPR